MALWARYLRKVHVAYCPFSANATPAVFLKEISTKQVAAISPKLAVSKTLLPNVGDAKPFTELTYADGSKGRLELGAIQIRDVIEEIEMSNVRVSHLELKRGKPFP